MTMFEKILRKEKNDLAEPAMPNKEKLLKEIRDNNCREIISTDINLKVLEQDEVMYPDKKEQVEAYKKQLRERKKDLIIGCKYIDEQLHEIAKGVQK